MKKFFTAKGVLSILLMATLFSVMAIMLSACGKNAEPTQEAVVEEVDPGQNQHQPEHMYGDYRTIDDDNHCRWCHIHNNYDLEEPHSYELISETKPYLSYDSEDNWYYVIDYGYKYYRCSGCGHEKSVDNTAADVDELDETEKQEFETAVAAKDYSNLITVKFNNGGYAAYYVYNVNGFWFSPSQNVGIDLKAMNVLNKLNRILDVFTGDCQVYKVMTDPSSSAETVYLYQGYVQKEYANEYPEDERLIPAQVVFDEEFRPIEMYSSHYDSYYNKDFGLSYEEPTEPEDIAELNQAKENARLHLSSTAFVDPGVPSFDTGYSRSTLEYYSRDYAYKYYEQFSYTDENVKYFLQTGILRTTTDTLYGIYDHGTVYYLNVTSENNNEEYIRAHKTTTTRSEFYNHVSLIEFTKEVLASLVGKQHYVYMFGDEKQSWIAVDDGYYKIVTVNGVIMDIYYYTSDLSYLDGVFDFFSYEDIARFNISFDPNDRWSDGYSFPDYLYSVWHTHRYADTYEYDNDQHWYTVACGCADAEVKEDHNFSWSITTDPTPYADGIRTGTCACGYVTTESVDHNDYIWTYADNLDFAASGDGFTITCVGTPATGDPIEVLIPVERGSSITKEDYLTAISGATNPYHALMAIVTNYSTQSHDAYVYSDGDAEYAALMDQYTIDADTLDALTNEGYGFNIYTITPQDDDTVVYYVMEAHGTNLNPLIIYMNVNGFATIYYDDYDISANKGILTLIYYSVEPVPAN